MKNFSRLLLTGALATTLTGCIIVGGEFDDYDREISASEWSEIERNNRTTIASLNIGEGYDAIQGRMGEASFSEAFQVDGTAYQVLYYRTHRTHSDGDTTKDETTPLVFKDKVLIGWGEEALARVR